MFTSREDSASAVLFLSREGIIKELLHSEFEALLDGFTPEKEWAGRDAKAVYLELNPDLKPKAAVFFTVSFDDEGWVESSWNVPLVNLARTAKPGINMGGGAMRVATAQDCPDPQYKSLLWTPDLSPNSKVLGWIREALAVNRLGLTRRDGGAAAQDTAPANNTLGALMSGAMEQQFAQLMESQMQGASGVAQTLAELEQTKSQYEGKLMGLQSQLAEQVRQFENAKVQLDQLQQTLQGKEQKLAELREYYELKLEKTKGAESDHIKALREYYENETTQQVASAESEYKELLNWREVELMYRAERETQLHEEIAKLRQHNTELELTGKDDLLQKLSHRGISFMTYQVGLGHIAIPVDDIALYLANPIGFVSAYCNVTQAVYLDWLAHFHAPVCRAQNTKGEPCGADVTRVDTPEHYLPGVSDCCTQHQNRA